MKHKTVGMTSNPLFAGKGEALPVRLNARGLRDSEPPRMPRRTDASAPVRVSLPLDGETQQRLVSEAARTGTTLEALLLAAFNEYMADEAQELGNCACLARS